MLGLGEFATDGYADSNLKYLLWIYFILATLMTQIIFFNILIAVVSDTYAHITENRELYALMQRTEIFGDFIHLMKVDKTMNSERFLYLVMPASSGGDDDNWEGSVALIKDQIRESGSDTCRAIDQLK